MGEKFPERYRGLKLATGLTYQEIADRLGLKLRAAKSYAMGESTPDFARLLMLAELFDVSLDYLVGRTDKREVNR